jgi:hypothetical protein
MKVRVIKSLNESGNPQVTQDIGCDGGHAGRQKRNDGDFHQMIFLDPDADLGSVELPTLVVMMRFSSDHIFASRFSSQIRRRL